MIESNLIILQTGIVENAQAAIDATIAFLPRLVGAIAILLVGWFVGRVAFRLVSRIADRIELDRMLLKTPLGTMLGGTERAVSRSFGTLAAWFIYAVAILAAADVLAIDLLSAWLSTVVSYLPSSLAGALIVIAGFIIADVLADVIARTETVTDTRYTRWFADGMRVFLYFVAIVMGLDTAGVDTGILFVFAQAAAWGLAAGIALAIGIGFGWGGKDFVAENIANWFGRTPTPMAAGQTDGGEVE